MNLELCINYQKNVFEIDPPLSGSGRAGVEGGKAEPTTALRASVLKSVTSIGQTSPMCHPQGGDLTVPRGGAASTREQERSLSQR